MYQVIHQRNTHPNSIVYCDIIITREDTIPRLLTEYEGECNGTPSFHLATRDSPLKYTIISLVIVEETHQHFN